MLEVANHELRLYCSGRILFIHLFFLLLKKFPEICEFWTSLNVAILHRYLSQKITIKVEMYTICLKIPFKQARQVKKFSQVQY